MDNFGPSLGNVIFFVNLLTGKRKFKSILAQVVFYCARLSFYLFWQHCQYSLKQATQLFCYIPRNVVLGAKGSTRVCSLLLRGAKYLYATLLPIDVGLPLPLSKLVDSCQFDVLLPISPTT